MDALPYEILNKIFEYLDVDSLIKAMEVSKRWSQIIKQHSLKAVFPLTICDCNFSLISKLKTKYVFKNITVINCNDESSIRNQVTEKILDFFKENKSNGKNIKLVHLEENVVLKILELSDGVESLELNEVLESQRIRLRSGIVAKSSCEEKEAHNKYLDKLVELCEDDEEAAEDHKAKKSRTEAPEPKIEDLKQLATPEEDLNIFTDGEDDIEYKYIQWNLANSPVQIHKAMEGFMDQISPMDYIIQQRNYYRAQRTFGKMKNTFYDRFMMANGFRLILDNLNISGKVIKLAGLKSLKIWEPKNIFNFIFAPNLINLALKFHIPEFERVILENPERFNQQIQNAINFDKIKNFLKSTKELKILELENLPANCSFGYEEYPFMMEKLKISTFGCDKFYMNFSEEQRSDFSESILLLLDYQKHSLKEVKIDSKFLKFSLNQILPLIYNENSLKIKIKNPENFSKSTKSLKYFGSLENENELIELIAKCPKIQKLGLFIYETVDIDALQIIQNCMQNLQSLLISSFFTQISQNICLNGIQKLSIYTLYEGSAVVDWDKIVMACPNITELSFHDDCFRISSIKFSKILKTSKKLKFIKKHCRLEYSVDPDFYKCLLDALVPPLTITIFGKIKDLKFTNCLLNKANILMKYDGSKNMLEIKKIGNSNTKKDLNF